MLCEVGKVDDRLTGVVPYPTLLPDRQSYLPVHHSHSGGYFLADLFNSANDTLRQPPEEGHHHLAFSSSTISESFLRASGRLRKLRPIAGEESSVCESNAFIRPIL